MINYFGVILMKISFFVLLILIFGTTIFSEAYKIEQNLDEDYYQKLINRITILEEALENFPNNYETLVDLGIIYHDIGLEGNHDALKRAKILFEKAKREKRQNPEIDLRYGSVLTLLGGYMWFPPARMWYVLTGVSDMKKVIEKDSDNLLFRFIRAETCYIMTEFDFCTETAINDYEYIIFRLENLEAPLEMISVCKARFKLAKSYERERKINKTIELLETIIETNCDLFFVSEARYMLSYLR